jgi:molybdopterin converting factor small subunit
VKVKVSIVAFLGVKVVNKVLDVEISDGSTILDLFNKIEKDGEVEKGFFKTMLSQRRPVTVLINGERIDISKDKKRKLSNGDEISIVSPIAGG